MRILLTATIFAALSVPPVAFALWWFVRRIRRAHRDD